MLENEFMKLLKSCKNVFVASGIIGISFKICKTDVKSYAKRYFAVNEILNAHFDEDSNSLFIN